MSEKRELSDNNGHGAYNKRPRTEGAGDGSPGVSKVLHVRNVASETQEELVAFVSQFGSVSAICFLAKMQALVQMESPQAASAVVMYSKTTPVYIRGQAVTFSYSKSQEINTKAATPKSSGAPASIHHILLCTILNPIYNITVDVMHAIMSPYGNVLRIVVFTKNGVQSLVEFSDAYSAVQAYTALDGKDIYAGSCTLKIEFSRAEKLNVHVNDDKSHDYTNAQIPSVPSAPVHAYNAQQPFAQTPYPPAPGVYGGGFGAQPSPAAPPAVQGMSPVLIVYGLGEILQNVDKIFNLFCVYGNVHKIKLMTNKKGSCMVHMENAEQAEKALSSLNGVVAFGEKLLIHFSKHQYIAESRADVEAAEQDNPPVKDFTTSQFNRFRMNNPNAAKHVYKPTITLYFANAPREFNGIEDFVQLFTSLNAPAPKDTKFFAPAHPGTPGAIPAGEEARARVGLVEFNDVPSAVAALVLANNYKVNGTHVLRLSFTANSINNTRGGHHHGGGGGGAGVTIIQINPQNNNSGSSSTQATSSDGAGGEGEAAPEYTEQPADQ